MNDLASKDCVPCHAGTPALPVAEQRRLHAALDPAWHIVEGHHLVRDFRFTDFAAALEFTNQVGALAEAQKHHPDLELGWGRVRVLMWTHAIDGLSENDFVLAAKIDRVRDAA